MKQFLVLVCLFFNAVALEAAEAVVSSVSAVQRPGKMMVDVTYDLTGDPGTKLWMGVELSEDGGKTYRALNQGLTGDFGQGIAPGANKRFVWEPGVEWLGCSSAALRFRVTAHSRGSVPGMVWIGSGSFVMGSPAGERGRYADEGPQTRVTLTKGYWLGKHEVTQGEWVALMGHNPSHFQGDADLPVESVSWSEAMKYCRRLTERERPAGRVPPEYEYRLPTEAQWEYACRAGTTAATAFGGSLSSAQANFDGPSYNGGDKGPTLGRTAKVESYGANGWGLSDMHGNVNEWCLDWYQDRLPDGSVTDPKGPTTGLERVSRGGSWLTIGRGCRSAYRGQVNPEGRSQSLGFRVALVAVR